MVLDGSLQYVECVPYATILQIFRLLSMIWYCRVQSPAMSKRQRWTMMQFSLIDSVIHWYLWESCIDRIISTPSCSYCIWNRYCQNHRRIMLNFQLLVWFDEVEFNCMPYPNDKMYDDAVFADAFRYSLAMLVFGYIARAISTPSCSYCIWNRYYQNHRSILPEFPIVCMIWYGWIQSSAMFKQQDVRWHSYRWSISISIDCVWSECINRAISTPR